LRLPRLSFRPRGYILGLEVTVANPYNAAARRLYERLGYRDAAGT
jgi:ribosomal protein S18 acetylase RimI-like enzyme